MLETKETDMRKLLVIPVLVAGLLTAPAAANAHGERFWTGAALGAGAGAILAGPVGAVAGGAAGAIIGGPKITTGHRHRYGEHRRCYSAAGHRVKCPPRHY